jgi:hypothetical protein
MGILLPATASAATVNGKWRVGPLLDVKIAFIKGGTRGIALNNVSACKVKKGDDVWQIKKGANGAFGTSEFFAFPGGVCYGRHPAVQASFFLRPNNKNILRVCGANGLKAGVPPKTDFSSTKATYPCADYKRIVKKNPATFKAVGSLEYYLKASRSPAKRCPSTGPQTYNVYFKAFAADPILRIDTVTLNGKVPEVYDGGLNQGHISVPTTIRKKTVTVDVKFTTESGLHRGFYVKWPPCVPD